MTINLFALLDVEDESIRRIPLTGPLQHDVSAFLVEQRERFCSNNHEKVSFDGNYRIEDGEIYCIEAFPMQGDIIDAVKNPLNYGVLDLRKTDDRIKALFFGELGPKTRYIGFQVFDSRKILKKGLTILNAGNTYKKLEDPGLTLQNSIAALYEHGNFLFYSYFNAKKIVDLSLYYEAATDEEIESFAENQLFQVNDLDLLKTNSDQVIRKKIALLQKNAVLQGVSLPEIRKCAKEYGVALDIRAKKIVIPGEKKALKELVRFLDEDYFTAPLSKRKCLTNSKKYLQ